MGDLPFIVCDWCTGSAAGGVAKGTLTGVAEVPAALLGAEGLAGAVGPVEEGAFPVKYIREQTPKLRRSTVEDQTLSMDGSSK